MKRQIICIPLLLAVSAHIHAQSVRSQISAFYTESDPYSVITSEVFSTAANQATLAGVRQFSAGVYGEKRFLLQDLGYYKAAFAMPSKAGNFGLNMDYTGSSTLHTSRFGLGYGRKLGEKTDVGIQFNYHTVSAAGYGRVSAITVEGGMIFQLNSRLRTGFHFFNPQGAGASKEERPAAVYTAGLGYDASENLSLNTIIQKTEDMPVDALAVIQYRFDNILWARIGLSAGTSVFLVGTGIVINELRIDVSASIHPSLGITPGLLLIYQPALKS